MTGPMGDVSSKVAFAPFVWSPTAHQQMELIIGGPLDSKTEAQFRVYLFAGLEAHQPGDVSIRFFDLGGELVFAFVFTTDAIEPSTKRTGLKIAIGFSIEDYIYVAKSELPIFISRVIWNLLNQAFDLNLPGDGAGRLIEKIMGGDSELALSTIKQEFDRISLAISTARPAPLGPVGRWARRWLWKLSQEISAPPKCLLVLNDKRGDAVNTAFDALVFEIIERNQRTLRGASTAGQLERGEIAIRHLDLGTPVVKGSTVVQRPDVNYVVLY
jgi:hypothetical protein